MLLQLVVTLGREGAGTAGFDIKLGTVTIRHNHQGRKPTRAHMGAHMG